MNGKEMGIGEDGTKRRKGVTAIKFGNDSLCVVVRAPRLVSKVSSSALSRRKYS